MVSTTHSFKTEGSRSTSNWSLILDTCLGEILALPVLSSIVIWRAVKDSEDYLPYYLIYSTSEGLIRRQALQKE